MEEIKKQTPSLERLLGEFDIPALSRDSLDSQLVFLNGSPPLSVREVLQLTRDEIAAPALKVINRDEKQEIESEKHGGGERPKRETGQIRAAYEKMRNRWESEAPRRVLATIVANPGKEAQWTKTGLRGVSGDLMVPGEYEFRWWAFVYGSKKEGIEVESWWGDLKGLNIMHALFIMRSRKSSLGPEVVDKKRFEEFSSMTLPLVEESEEELIENLRKVNEHFQKR